MTRDWRTILSEQEALWLHDGSTNPHALLTSGKHSDGFCNTTRLIQNPKLLEKACIDIMHKFSSRILDVNWVVGSALGAVTIAHAMAVLLDTKMAFTEPVQTEDGKDMQLKRFSIASGDKVLVVEDVFTTGGTTRKTIAALERIGADVHEDVVVLVNRSNLKYLDTRYIMSLVNIPMTIWEPDSCPLCAKGSEAIRPKGNWKKLNANS